MKKVVSKAITLDDLARMVARGFSDVSTEFKSVYSEFGNVRSEMKNEFKKINNRLDDIDNRLGKIENNHKRRLENVEDKIRIISTILERDLKIKLPK